MGTSINIPITAAGWKFVNGGGPNGANGCYIGSGSSCSQDLGVSPAHFQEYKPGYCIAGFYTLTFDIVNKLPSYPGYYTAELDYGTQELGEMSGWATNVSTQVMLVCPSPGYLIIDKSLPSSGPPQGQSNFELKFSSSTEAGWPLLIDNVSLTFTPSN